LEETATSGFTHISEGSEGAPTHAERKRQREIGKKLPEDQWH
jgi:hypothetical protein